MSLFSDDASDEGGTGSARTPGVSTIEDVDGAEAAERSRTTRSRRVGAALVAVASVLLLVMALSPAPYVIQTPGPVFDTLGGDHPLGSRPTGAEERKPLITVKGHATYPTTGSLDLLTVSEIGDPDRLPNWGQVLQAWFSPADQVVPLDSAYPPGEDLKRQNAQNAQLMTDSQKDAVAAALNQLGYDFPQRIMVRQVVDGPAKGVIEVGDRIVAVNGVAVKGVQSLREELRKNGTGAPASILVERNGARQTVSVRPRKTADGVVIGIGAQMDYEFPFQVTIRLDDVGGPSAGQMFALGVIDKLTPGSLNGGARVAGTGTIDNEGNVGAIGGIRQKMFAARGAGASVFLAPAANCDEVTGHIPSGLHVYAVGTLHDSLKVLDAVRTGSGTAHLPTCPAS